jgi:hypothetical protein
MPRIPYNPNLAPARPQAQGRVNLSGAMNAVGREAAANQQLAGMFQGAIGTGMAAVRDDREKEIYADKLGFETQLKDAQSRLKIALEGIPVADGVDVQAETRDIIQREYGTLRDYLSNPGNVRHKQAMKDFELRLQAAEADANRAAGEYVAGYERDRSASRGARMVEVGIKEGDESMIEQGVFVQHEAGKLDENTATSVYEKSVERMKEIGDQTRLEQFNAAKMDGDWERAREIVDGMQGAGWTKEKKANFIREERSRAAYSETALAIQQAEGRGEFEDLKKQVEERKDLTAQNRPVLMRSVNAGMARLERAQISNERSLLKAFERGEGDWEAFERMKGLDTAEGLTPDAERALRPILEAEESQYEMQVRFERDEQSVAYKAMLNELAAARFAKTSTGRIDTNTPDGKKITPARRNEYQSMLEEINALPVGTKAKARLLDEWMQIRATDLLDPGEEDPRGFFSSASEILGDEAKLRGELIANYRALLEDGTVPDDFGQSVEQDDKRVAEFFRKTKDPTPEQLKQLRQEVLAPREAATIRRKARGETRASEFKRGQRVEQGGVTYEFDGTNWNPVR